MGQFKNLKGLRLGRLTVIKKLGKTRTGGEYFWKILCDCGRIKQVRSTSLTRDKRPTRCCGLAGCPVKKEVFKKKHGMSGTSLYKCWVAMRQRCSNPDNQAFMNYGGRGIRVCERWNVSFLNFKNDIGERPSPEYSLDRYPDNNGDYKPGNVRWATKLQQNINQRKKAALFNFTIGELKLEIERRERLQSLTSIS